MNGLLGPFSLGLTGSYNNNIHVQVYMIAWLDLVAFVQTNHCCNLQDSHVAWTLENKSSLSNPEPTEFFYSFSMVNQWIIWQGKQDSHLMTY